MASMTDIDQNLASKQHKTSVKNHDVFLTDLLGEPMAEIEKIIQTTFQNEKLPMLQAISGHIIGSGGKRIRPLLMLALAHLVNSVIKPEILTTAAAIEFIHTATLLHDDVIDNGDQRRGKKTAHLIWGNQASVLAGDHMFACAFAMLADIENFASMQMMSQAAKMLAEGEMAQLSLKQKVPSYDAHFYVLGQKTAALFAAGCASGVILAEGNENQIHYAYDFGYNFGISFQLIDDILDYHGDSTLGKKIGGDFYEGKFTLPLILTYHQASDDEKKAIERLMLRKQERTEDDFLFIKDLIESYDTIKKARIIAMTYIQKSEECLVHFDRDNPVYISLEEMIHHTLYRRI